MRANSPFSYRLLLQSKQIGPFDRRTVVGMRMKKIISNDVAVMRNDGLMMNVGQLMADRFETTDALTGQILSMPGMASEIWPTFLVDFGGGLRAGAMGFVGRGELRFESDKLRLSGQRKRAFFGSRSDRIKIAIADIAAINVALGSDQSVAVNLRLGHPLAPTRKGQSIILKLDDPDSAQELVGLVHAAL